MADLGSIALDIYTDTPLNSRRVVSTVIYRPPTLLDLKLTDIDTSGSISGVVKIDDVLTAGVRVGLYDRTNMQLVETDVSDNIGAYSFLYLDTNYIENYFVIILDPKTSAPWNHSAVLDHLTPG